MKDPRPIDRYYAFISNKQQLVSFSRDGDVSSYFFPRMDAFQNLERAARWVQVGSDVVPLNEQHFEIDFRFNDTWDRLCISYRRQGLALSQTYAFDDAGNRLIVELTVHEGQVAGLHHLFAWMLCGSTPYHCVRTHGDRLEIFKQDLHLSLASKHLDALGIIDPGTDNEALIAGAGAILAQRPAAPTLYCIDAALAIKAPPWPSSEFLSAKVLVSFRPAEGELRYSLEGAQVQPLTTAPIDAPQRPADRRFGFLPGDAGLPPALDEEDPLIRTSVAALNMLQAGNGAILASYEQDEGHGQCGGYGFSWGRDGAFIADAMKTISSGFVEKVFDFFFSAAQPCEKIPGARFLKQRYQTNGLPAPGWGEQFDESGSLLWSYARCRPHLEGGGDAAAREAAVRALIDFLLGIIEPEIDLFQPSIDIWEERYGYHLYSQLACLKGLEDGLRLLAPETRAAHYAEAPARLEAVRTSIRQLFLVRGIAVRSILKPPVPPPGTFAHWADELLRADHLAARPELAAYGMGPEDLDRFRPLFHRGFLPDFVPDIANLALIYPFDALGLSAQAAEDNIAHLDRFLLEPRSTLHYRYAGDPYVGGNAWVLATLWLGIAETRCGRPERGRERLESAARAANGLSLLPEQVDAHCRPCWIQPLGWSHAFYLTLSALLKRERGPSGN